MGKAEKMHRSLCPGSRLLQSRGSEQHMVMNKILGALKVAIEGPFYVKGQWQGGT